LHGLLAYAEKLYLAERRNRENLTNQSMIAFHVQ
jgi:hypothetical protein